MLKTESFQAFKDKANELFGITGTSLTSHFKGTWQKGKKSIPHFFCDFSTEQLEKKMGIEQDRVMIEKVGLNVARKHLEMLSNEEGFMKTSDAISLLKAVNTSADNRKLVKLKEREVKDKDTRFNKMLNAALYGVIPVESDKTHIRDAEVHDTGKIIPRIDSSSAEESLRCDSEG